LTKTAEELAHNDRCGEEQSASLTIFYDGECPFCSAYVKLVKLKEAVGPVTLIDARRRPEVVAAFRDQGVDLDDTMVVIYGGVAYAGAEAVEILSLLSSDTGFVNRLIARLLRDKRRAQRLYPILRCGRNLALKLLGRSKIEIPNRA
jgi:predicted DCC family thiol-disulfide oxidoreductase YuxK